MSDSMFTDQWYKIRELAPQVRHNVFVHRHRYRGTPWYIVGSSLKSNQVRLNNPAFFLYSQFDGEKDIESIWNSALASLGDDAPSQGEVLNLLSELFEAGLIEFRGTSDVDQLFENRDAAANKEQRSRWLNPLFLRLPLCDPDRLVGRLSPWFDGFFSKAFFVSWVVALLLGALLMGTLWPDIAARFNSDLVSPRNLIIMWFVFPLMKLLHELAHALAVKKWGGEVHEAGVALLILLPVPFVDASASSAFPNKYHRMAVAAAGIVVESTLAVLGLVMWALVEPGWVSDIAFNVMVTGTVSSILFNANPLLKFDGYYVFSDALEIPSLANRANQFWLFLIQKYLLRIDPQQPVLARGEGVWFFGYGLAAFVYRIFLSFTICLLVASQYFFIGVLLALWAFGLQILLPLAKGIRFVLFDPRVGQTRMRAVMSTAGVVGVFVVLFGVLPVPHITHVRGVVWPVDNAMIRAETDCLVEAVLVSNHSIVQEGAHVVRCEKSTMQAQVAGLRAQEKAARAEVYAARDKVEREIRKGQLEVAVEVRRRAQENLQDTIARAKVDGVLFVPDGPNLVGRFFKQGETLGYVVAEGNISVRTLVSQERVALFSADKAEFEHVEIYRSGRQGNNAVSALLRRVPAASRQLSVPALGIEGGGDLLVERDAQGQTQLQQAAFEFEVQLPDSMADALIGEAVEVRFHHGWETPAGLLVRQLRLLFLRHFNV